MKKIRLLTIMMVLAMLLSVAAGCSSSATPTAGGSDAASAADKIKVGITYQNLQNEFILSIQDAARAKAAELGIELIEVDGQGNAETQISQVENFISQGVDAIILNPFDNDGCVPAVEKAVAANIPIIVVNGTVANVDKASAYVGSDSVESGRIEMQYAADMMNGKGNIVVIHGPNGHSAEIDRTAGINEILAKYPEIKIVAEQTANWDRAQGMTLMENWLQSGLEIDCVVAQNDEMGLGAYVAIEAAGKQADIKVIGIDAIPDALAAVEAGKFIGTVFQDAAGQGAKSVEVAVLAGQGETIDKSYMIPYLLVTKDNLADFK
ncbi:MAG: substrate-binding domain-containing protein [Saccharofermentanales bacterium]